MSVQSIIFTLQNKFDRRSFLRRSLFSGAAASAIGATLLGKKGSLFARNTPYSALTDPATRSSDNIYFSVIGDYGREDSDVARVASMIRSWEPDFITTVGDNIYDYEDFSTIDNCIGQYFTRFLSPYNGEHGEDSGVNRFFPILGNHDWESIEVDENGTCSGPYFDFFPEAGPYYTIQKGPVRFFMLDSEEMQPAGITALSDQAMWLRDQLAQSDATWNLVYLHHPPYSSGIKHGSHWELQWPFQQWGAHAVLSGHNHTYERLERNGIVYLVNGLGGTSQHGLSKPRLAGSQAGYTGGYGAMLVSANDQSMTFQFLGRDEVLIDDYTMLITDFPVEPEPEPIHNYNIQELRLSRRLESSTDRTTEQSATGTAASPDHLLEFGSDEFTSAVRFRNLSIPRDAEIIEAVIEFTASEPSVEPATAQIIGEKSCYAHPYTDEAPSIAQRPVTASQVEWANIEPWHVRAASYYTPNLATILQELIAQSHWSDDNAVAFNFSGQGKRSAVAFDLQPAAAPKLHVHYTIPLLSDSQQASASAETDREDTDGNKIYLPAIATTTCDIPEE